MKIKKDKTHSYNHTRERMAERCQITINEKDYKKLNRRFTQRKILIEKRQKDQTIFVTEFQNQLIRFVWSNERQTIITALKLIEGYGRCSDCIWHESPSCNVERDSEDCNRSRREKEKVK